MMFFVVTGLSWNMKRLSPGHRFSQYLILLVFAVSSLTCVASTKDGRTTLKRDNGFMWRSSKGSSDGHLPSRPSSSPEDLFFEPYFDNNTARNMTVQLGKTAHLTCTIHELGERTVTWVRQKDLHILTIGKYTYISDTRFKASNDQGSDTWSLEIKNSKESDAGIYECQVSTEDTKTLQMSLQVIASRARIIEGKSLYVETGSSISVSCQVTHTIYPSEYIVWYHSNFIIRNGDRNSRVNIRTDRRDMDFSELSITNAKSTDSGEYSCKPSAGHAANITIMVLNGEETAAMQHGHKNHQSQLIISCQVWSAIFITHSWVLSLVD